MAASLNCPDLLKLMEQIQALRARVLAAELEVKDLEDARDLEGGLPPLSPSPQNPPQSARGRRRRS